MTIDPHDIFAGLATAMFLGFGFDVGISFLMRGEREAGKGDRD